MQQLLKIETNINPILKVAKIRIPNALDRYIDCIGIVTNICCLGPAVGAQHPSHVNVNVLATRLGGSISNM